jgi:hypothetical protein
MTLKLIQWHSRASMIQYQCKPMAKNQKASATKASAKFGYCEFRVAHG